MSQSAAVEPVVDQVEGRARGHDSQRHAVDSERGNRCFQLLGFEPLFHELDRCHRQGADDVEHVLSAHGAQFESQLGEGQAFAQGFGFGQARHRGAVGGIEKGGRFGHEGQEVGPARRVFGGEAFDGFGCFSGIASRRDYRNRLGER